MAELYLAFDRDLRAGGRHPRRRPRFMLLHDHGVALHAPGYRELRALADCDAVCELEPRRGAVLADQRVDALAARAVLVDEIEDRKPARERYGGAVGQGGCLGARTVRVDVMR